MQRLTDKELARRDKMRVQANEAETLRLGDCDTSYLALLHDVRLHAQHIHKELQVMVGEGLGVPLVECKRAEVRNMYNHLRKIHHKMDRLIDTASDVTTYQTSHD